MATSYLSFASIAELHNNNPRSVSPIGELTNKAKTYAKDPGTFTVDGQPSATVLYNFLSVNGTTEIKMPPAIAARQLEISNWLLAQAKLGNISDSRTNTLNLLKAQFTSNIEITDIGEMVTNNVVWMPSFVAGNHIVGTEKQSFYLWMADAYFKREYPWVSFAVVHPVPLGDMDSLMPMNWQQMDARLALETPDLIEQRLRLLTDNSEWPYTDRDVIMFELMDLINTGKSSKAYWRYVWWGNGVDADDQLLEQMQQEILDNSEYDREEWEEKIPDLFNPIEFYVLPFFNRKGLLNKTSGAREYSPIVDKETEMELVDKYLTPNMTADHVIKSTQFVPTLYRSLACAFVGKVNNREGTKKIYDLFSDYSLRPSSDSSFGEMNAATMEFIRQLENLVAAAETMTDISLPPSGVTRVKRFDKVYAAKRVGKVKYLVLTKWQMQEDGVEGL